MQMKWASDSAPLAISMYLIRITKVAFGVLLLAAAMLAQLSKEDSESAQSLSSQSQQVLQKLASLSTLPDADWKFHAGDVAHGEEPSLDDSDWQVAHPHSKAPMEAVWYRQWIEVPKDLNGYDLTGARIWFQFVAYANGPMPEIIYFNGRRVAE